NLATSMTKLRVLIIEDHHLMIEGYKSMLGTHAMGFDIEITTLETSHAAYQFLTSNFSKKFDIVFLDWSIPAYEEKNIWDGGYLIKYIKSHSPSSKIVVLTAHTEAFTLYSITKEIKPAALLAKCDFLPSEILKLLLVILANDVFYSPTVK